MAKKRKQKTVRLPPYKGEMYRELANVYCAACGRNPTPKNIQALVQNFAREDYLHSLTPNPAMKNPFTPRIAKKTKRLQPFFGPGGVFQSRPGTIPLTRARDLKNRFEGAVINISHVYMEMLADKLPSDMAYDKGASQEEMKEADLARYFRLYVWLVTTKLMEVLFTVKPDEIDQYLEKEVAPRVTARDVLRDPSTRERFVRELLKDLDTALAPVKGLGARLVSAAGKS